VAVAVKWSDPAVTADGKTRATVEPVKLETLWFNTGTLCNIECANCYIESSPKNDRLAYLTRTEVESYLDEIERGGFGTREIGFTGGEPFLNPEMTAMAEACLERGFEVLILTNAMKPLANKREAVLDLKERYGAKLRFRVSLDHYSERVHDAERGAGSFSAGTEGLRWLSENGFSLSVAGRSLTDEAHKAAKEGYRELFASLGVSLDVENPEHLVVFPEMDEKAELPEITTECWGILDKKPSSVMCASSRMVVKRKGDDAPSVQACTLLAYDERFSTGRTLEESWKRPVSLVHPHCASFCVLGGASCSG
jgi:MoaA/NifB/PqqE/SkfB family radical SAM enzyme